MCEREEFGPQQAVTISHTIEWLTKMCRKHRFICVSWKRLYVELNGAHWDATVARTLDAMGLRGSPNWELLLREARIRGVQS